MSLSKTLRPSLGRLQKGLIKALTPAAQALSYEVLFRHQQQRLFATLVEMREAIAGKMIRLEASSVCQLRCPACSVSRWRKRGGSADDGEGGIIGWGLLRYDDFARLLDENPGLRTVELSNWGEIFLNPELIPMMRLAHARGVKLRAVNGVNFNRVDDEVLRALVDYRFGPITVSIDGATHETYKRYRRGGSLGRVLRNIRRLERYKEQRGRRDPKLTWQFIVFGHNEHELEQAQELAAELNMNFKAKLNHTPSFSPVRDQARVRRLIGGPASREEFLRDKRRAYSRPCTQLWTSPQINWDGKLLGCCANKLGDFGNVFELGLREALRGERYRYAQRMVLGLAPPRDDIPCARCKVYRKHVLGSLHGEQVIRRKARTRG